MLAAETVTLSSCHVNGCTQPVVLLLINAQCLQPQLEVQVQFIAPSMPAALMPDELLAPLNLVGDQHVPDRLERPNRWQALCDDLVRVSDRTMGFLAQLGVGFATVLHYKQEHGRTDINGVHVILTVAHQVFVRLE